tara:strand:+ start:42 stop:296 length:255 start_codon:yes stop_codon:yes gene_type:complete
MSGRRQVVSSIGFEKKNWKNLIFSNLFSSKSYFFCMKLSSMRKMLSFEILHVGIAQKLRNLNIFAHFLAIFHRFLIFPNCFVVF